MLPIYVRHYIVTRKNTILPEVPGMMCTWLGNLGKTKSVFLDRLPYAYRCNTVGRTSSQPIRAWAALQRQSKAIVPASDFRRHRRSDPALADMQKDKLGALLGSTAWRFLLGSEEARSLKTLPVPVPTPLRFASCERLRVSTPV